MKKIAGYSWTVLLLLSGCAPLSPVPLDYAITDSKSGVDFPQALSVGLFQFEDLRGWDPKVAAREIRMISFEFPISTDADSRSDKEVRAFVSEAIKKELEPRGLSVSTEGDYAQVVGVEELRSKLKSMHLSSDRVILGRIKYLNLLEPGFAGFLFQAMMPNGKAYVDLDLIVIDPRTSNIKWSGQARSKVDSGTSWGSTPEEKGKHLTTGLRNALEKIFLNAGFAQAFLP